MATYKKSYTPKNSRITWPPYLKSEYGNLAHYFATYKNSYTPKYSRITWPLFSRQTSLNSRITWPLIKIYIKILILLRTRELLAHLTLTKSSEISRISWPLYKNSYTPKNSRITWPPYFKSEYGNLAHYFATYKNSYTPKYSRITWPLFSRHTSLNSRITWLLIKSLILLRTRALLGHLT